MQITKIADGFSVAPQIAFEDVEKLANAGYKTIINNRPDGEDAAQPLSKAIAKAAKQAGLAYHHIPFKPGRFTPDDQAQFKAAMERSSGPVLAFCRTGMRAQTIYKKSIYKKAIHKSATKAPGFFASLFGR